MRQNELSLGCLEINTSYNGRSQQDLSDIIINIVNSCQLDIFVAPEWLFLPENRVYSKEEKESITGEIAQKTKGKPTLILPGTFMWQDKQKMYNSMPIITHGKVIGEYFKNRDGGDKNIAKLRGLEVGYGQEKGREIQWQNLRIGLEICADHSYRNLQLNDRIKELDLHIITACSVSMNEHALKLRVGGYGVLCDGSYPPQTQVKRRARQFYSEYDYERPIEFVNLPQFQKPAEDKGRQNDGRVVVYRLYTGE